MAQRKQLTWSELRVGLFVLAGLLVLAATILYVTGAGILAAKYRLRTYLPEVEGLKMGAPVRLDGVQIGNVDAIRMNPKPADRSKNIEVILRIDKDYQSEIRSDSRASLITEGLLGNRYVTIERGFQGAPLDADAVLLGKEEASPKLIVERGAELVQNLNALSATARDIVDAVQKGRGTLGRLLTDESAYNRLNDSLGRVQALVAKTEAGENTVGRLLASDELYRKVNDTAGKLQTIAGDVQAQKGSLGRLIYDPSLYDNAKNLVARGNAAIQNVEEGKGTLGKLYKDEALYNKWRDVGSNLEQATAKLNQNTNTAGRMFSDPALYDNLSGLSGDLRLLVGEFRQNPKKFLRVKFSIF
jgi:phospholipid/cholesterol/gamma-HCH transport system substrate-binding protein